VIVRLQTSLDQVEHRQMAALSSVEDGIGIAGCAGCAACFPISVRHGAVGSRDPRVGMGGPFVPVKLAPDAGPFERQLYRINITRAQVERLNRTLALVPYRKPWSAKSNSLAASASAANPFLGRPAMPYRARFPRRDRRPGAGDREWQSGVIWMGRRLWPHGRN